MSKIMLVNVTHVEESRVAVVEDGVLAAYEIETINRANLKGNIHNAVVESALGSLEAAFLKIGPDLKGFLPLDEVNFKLLPVRSESRKSGKIGQHLQSGQRLMVQVVREPFSGKPPTVSTYFSLPGRYLVLMPGVDSAGVSRKIENAAQRERLKKIVEELRPPEGFGVIVRTAGMGQTKVELQRDLRYLLRLWESIQRSSAATEFPGRVYSEADLVIRTIRDHLTTDIMEVWIDSEETHAKALEFVRDVMPSRAKTLRLYTGERPLFNKYNLEEQIERIYKRCVPLPSGGDIVIDGTEALTAIDVNSARSRRGADVEETSVQTNIEAAAEIARQLRLRHVGGLIVIDFIDMGSNRNKLEVEKAMRDAMRGDRAKYDLTRISKLGLMEIARQRIKSEKLAVSYATCPSCDGHGLIKNVESAALAALRKLQTRSGHSGIAAIRMGLPPEVATWIQNNKRERLLQIEQRQGVRIEIESRARLLRHETEFEITARPKGEPAGLADSGSAEAAGPRPAVESRAGASSAEPARKSAVTEPKVVPVPAQETAGAAVESAGTAEGEAEAAEGPRPRRRRKRRRRGRGSGSADPGSAGPDPQPSSKGDEPEPVDRVVPRGVRADELMPAAVGGARNKRKSSAGRRRRKSGTPSPESRRKKPTGAGRD